MANEALAPNGIDLRNNKGINALDPTNPQDVATKNYVDTNASGGRAFAWFAG